MATRFEADRGEHHRSVGFERWAHYRLGFVVGGEEKGGEGE